MKEIDKPRALVLTAPGINRDHATARAFEMVGGRAEVVHINQLKDREKSLEDFQIFSIPGGFSYGDHIQGGRILSLELQDNLLADQIYAHLERGRIILGVCNGFQVLVQSGLLPFGQLQPLDKNRATLANNLPDKFQSRWIHLAARESNCFFAERSLLNLPVAHSEGRFLTLTDAEAEQLMNAGQVVYQYAAPTGEPTTKYPDNPNGSPFGIAAICDPSGQILGMMPHAEDFVRPEHHPNWRRRKHTLPHGLAFFRKIVWAADQL